MTWTTLPFEPRSVRATEARLDTVYQAARQGMKGDTLALAAGMLPVEYRSLCEFDPLVGMAELKGRADGEMEMSGVLHDAARAGDVKSALDILKHVHGWVSRTAVDVSIDQRISITHALKLAQERVESLYTLPDDTDTSAPMIDVTPQTQPQPTQEAAK